MKTDRSIAFHTEQTLRAVRDKNAANKAFEKHYKKAFPKGSTVRYRHGRHVREVTVIDHLDHGTGSHFAVHNPTTGNSYQIAVWEILYEMFGDKVFANK